jgi:2-polyprenyl-6-methoxyphenol hydroxylase-like FAD-dependent oxidoreductase
MMNTKFDAVIMGAGIAGSTTAILLARAGWRVALVEKQSFPRRKVCGECIAAGNFPMLDALGVGDAVAQAAGPHLRQAALMRGEFNAMADLPEAEHAKHRWGMALGRETLDSILLDQAAANGATVFQPHMVQGVHGMVGQWQCEIRALDSKKIVSLHAPVMIDAHGSWESLHAGPARRLPLGSDLLAFKANFRNAALQQGVLPLVLFPGGYGGMVLADQGLTTVACCIRRDQLTALRALQPGRSAGDSVEAMLKRECQGVRAALENATRDEPWLAAGPLDPRIRIQPNDTVFRVGNAAGEAHPIIGEGMSMALQSAWLLCGRLTAAGRNNGAAPRQWQQRVAGQYDADWRRMSRSRFRIASLFAELAMRPLGAYGLMAAVQVWPGLINLGARWAEKAGPLRFPSSTSTFAPTGATP